MNTPILFASIRVEGKRIVLGGRVERAVDFDEPGLKRHLLAGIEAAAHFEPGDILGVDGVERGKALGRQRIIVAGPILEGRSGPDRSGAAHQARGGGQGW